MSLKIKKIFNKDKNIIIGAIHFPSLFGFSTASVANFDFALENALADLRAFEKGGADAVIIENNYDIPHTAFVPPEVRDAFMYLGEKIKSATKLPVGVSVLWNDYKTALTVAKALGLHFIRVPVFVDTVETSYGIMKGDATDVIAFRKSIGAEDVAIFTDIHVKHSKIISTYTISESARMAIEQGSDALIVTGRWTGEAPEINKVKEVRETVRSAGQGDFPIFCGSGIAVKNIKNLFAYANGAIVSTSVKGGTNDAKEVNVKGYDQRIEEGKVTELVRAVGML